MQKQFTLLRQNRLFAKLAFAIVFLSSFWIQQAYGQGAVYPLQSDVCISTPSYTLTWSGTSGTVDRWEKNDGSGWTTVANTTSSVTFPTPAAGTYTYRTYINLGGGNFQYSVIATVNVYSLSTADGTVSFTYDGSNRCESNNAGTVVLNGGYNGTINKWVYSLNNQAPWTAIGNSTNTLSYDDLPANTYYKVEIQNGICPAVLTTNSAQINVVNDPEGGVTSVASSPICEGTTTLLSVTGNSGTTFDWQLLNGGIWSNVSTGTTYTPSAALPSGVYNYRVNATLTCKDRTSATITKSSTSTVSALTISQTTAIANPTGDNVVSSADPTLNNIIVAPSNGSVLRWELSTDGNQWSPLTNSSNTYTYSNLTQSTYYRVVTKNGACNEAFSTTPVKITVANGGTVTASSTSMCSPSGASTLTVAGYEATSYTWESAPNPVGPWSAIQSNVASITVNNLTQTTYYRVNANSGKAYSNTLTISIAVPTVAGSLTTPSQSVCSGDATVRTIALNGNTGSVNRWEYSNFNGEPWTALANTTTTLDFNNITQTTWYRAVVQNGACTAEITPSIKVEVVNGGSVAGSTNICANDGIIRTLVLSGHTGLINYWERSEFDVNSSTWGPYQNVGNGGSVNFTYQNLSKSTRYRAVIISSCATDVTSAYAEIIVNSTSVGGTLASAATVRPGNNSGSITLAGQNGNVVRWESSLTNSAPWTQIANTTTTLSYVNLDKSTFYRAIVQNGACAEVVSSNTIKITMALNGEIAGAREVCASDPTVRTLTFENYNGTISRWQQSINNGTSWTDIPVTANKTTLNYSSLTQTTLYRAVVTEDGGDIFATPATITVNPLPIPSFTAPTVCFDNKTVFTSNSVIPSGTILSHNWYYADGKGTSIVSPTYTYAAAGTYAVKLVLISDKLCRDSITQNVVVSPLPATDFTFTNVCENKTMSFTNGTVLAGATLTYAWTFGNGSTSTLSDPTNVYPVKGKYNVTLNATANGTCSKSITKEVTVYENPVADFAFTNICDLTAMNFVNNSFISDGNLTYAWDFNDAAATSVLASPSYKFSKADTFNVKLTVTTPFACTHNVTKKVEVYPNPVVDFTPVNNCFGQVTTFTNNTTIATGSNTYVWDFKNGNTSTALNPTQTYNAAGSYYAKLTAKSDRNCTISKEKEVIVHYNPRAQFAFNNICANDTVAFKNLSSTYGDAITYTWNFADASATSNVESPLKVYATAKTYAVKLLVTSTFGCKDSTTQNVAVYPNPKANFTSSALTCNGKATNFTSTSTVASGVIKSHLYDFSNGTTSNLKNPSYKFASDGTFKTLLTVTTDRGCTDTITKSVTIANQPVPNFEFSSVCAGNTISFVNKTTSVDGSPSYSWSFGDTVGTSTQTSPSYVYNTPRTYTVKMIVQNANTCSDSITKNVEIYPNAVANFTKVDTCAGYAVNFKSTSSVVSGVMYYDWNFGNGKTSVIAEPTITYAKEGTYPVVLKITTDKGCITSKTISTIVDPNPVVSFVATDVCYAVANVFTNTTQLASGTAKYTWNFGDQLSDTASSTSHIYVSPGTYQVKLSTITDKGCVGSFTKSTDVFPKPNADFTFNNLCATKAVTFNNISTIESGTLTYLWQLGDNTTSTIKNAVNTYNVEGDYTVTLFANSDKACSDTIVKTIKIYPLPVPSFTVDSVCDGYTSKFINTTTSKDSVSYFQWDFDDLTNSLQKNPEHLFLNQGTYNVSLLARTINNCEVLFKKDVVVMPVPVANFSADAICVGNPSVLKNLTTNVTGSVTYTWKLADGTSDIIKTSTLIPDTSHTYLKGNTYGVKLIAKSFFGCVDSVTKGVVVHALPLVKLPKDTSVSMGVPLEITAIAANGTYAWTPNRGLDNYIKKQVVALPDTTTDYIFTVTDSNTCVKADTMKVTVRKDYYLMNINNTISNIVTPDGNGKNDTWYVPNIEFYPENLVQIFDRWGKLVYKAGNYKNDWSASNLSGDLLPDGTYYFVITFDGSDVIHKGTITVMRDMDANVLFK